MAEIARIEVFLDGQTEPLQVLTQAPYTLELDPRQFSPGDHHLTVHVVYTNGDFHRFFYAFTVQERNETFVGYLNRAPVSAPVQVHLIDPAEQTIAAVKPNAFVHGVLPALFFLLIAGVATWFAYIGDKPVQDHVTDIEPVAAAAVSGAPSSEEVGSPGAAPDGQALYKQHCATCHGPEGQGQGDVFPALAGNTNLADLEMVMDVVLHGRQGTAMVPWGQQMSDDEIAAVINYILSAWGNDFGTVTPDDIAQRR